MHWPHIQCWTTGSEGLQVRLCGEEIFEAEKETFQEHFGADANAAQPSKLF